MKVILYLGALIIVLLSCNSHNGANKKNDLLLAKKNDDSNNKSIKPDNSMPLILREYIAEELKQYIIPTTEDYDIGWQDFLEKESLPFIACSDFNGDNNLDYAVVLIQKGRDKSALFVFNATDKGYLYYKLEEYDVFNGEIATVVSIEKKGTWEAVNETITVSNDGLLVELLEESLSWAFYRNGQQYEKFLYD